jgi:hypothetical protein
LGAKKASKNCEKVPNQQIFASKMLNKIAESGFFHDFSGFFSVIGCWLETPKKLPKGLKRGNFGQKNGKPPWKSESVKSQRNIFLFMAFLDAETIGIITQVVSYFVYAATAIHFFDQKDNAARFRFLLIVFGFFFIVFFSEGAFSQSHTQQLSFNVRQMAIMSFLALAGVEMLIDRKIVLLLLAVFFASYFSSSWFFFSFFIGTAVYLIVAYGFIFSALKAVGKWFSR